MRWWLVLLIACGGGSEPSHRTAAVSPIATPSGPEDVVVAQVNGRPVYGSCVTAQAVGRKEMTKQQALDECIAFELLAQTAEARGFAKDPEVAEATRAALVNREVELGFEQKYQKSSDLAGPLSAAVRGPVTVRERRASAYIRYNLSPKAKPEDEAKAQQEISALVAKLAPEEGLLSGHLAAYAKEVDPKLEVADVAYFPERGLVPGYRDALFAIQEVGRIYPQPVRNQFGLDVVLLTGIEPEQNYTREQAAGKVFPEVRRNYFILWVEHLQKELGIRVVYDEKRDQKLEALQ
jgi:hypothetical protein